MGIAKVVLLFLVGTLCVSNSYAQKADLDSMIDRELPGLVETYKAIHRSPELSHHEQKTSALLGEKLRALGYTVTENVGRYENPAWHSYGVVAIMKNGSGPTVLVRTYLDALPVEEQTGLPYASTVKETNDAGQEVSVMHACGNDIHITNLIGTATMLARMKSEWHGTLMLIGQPAEEVIDGAKAMLNDNLYQRFGRPDFAIALHDNSDLEAGKIAYCPGYALASSTSVDVTIRGLRGHGSRPDATKDPIVAAAEFIMAIQTIVSRENSPLDPA
ncbi:MAG TPA: amidohydrolase, partial [Blastocatellia bacterium]|nr:amidohydrolase [Blastocatellia bacterium]